MSVITGLKKIKERQEKQQQARQRKDYFDYRNFLKPAAGEELTIRFAQEMDESAEGYDPERGLGIVAVEHKPGRPVFPRKILCTYDPETDTPCWACQYARSGDNALYNEWKQKQRLYINVLVKQDDDTWKVMVLDQGFGPKAVAEDILAWAEENDSITNLEFKFVKEGEGFGTQFSLRPMVKTIDKPFDYTGYELFDLSEVVNDVPYEDQERYLVGHLEQADEEAADEAAEEQAWV